jgi:hypothetical protein
MWARKKSSEDTKGRSAHSAIYFLTQLHHEKLKVIQLTKFLAFMEPEGDHGNGRSDAIKGREFLDYLSNS